MSLPFFLAFGGGIHVRGRRMGVAGLVLLLAAGCSAPRPGATPSKPDLDPTIQVSTSYCGQGWTHPHAGEQTLLIVNTGDVSADADLIDVPAGAVHAEIEGLAPGVTRPMRVTLGSGTYAIRCHPADSDPSVGPSVHIPGSASGGPATEPVSYTDLYGPAIAYQKDVATGLKMLTAKTKTLAKEV